MPMKSSDLATAVGLLIHGFLRANDDEIKGHPRLGWTTMILRDALEAIRRECDDWAENLELDNEAVEPDEIDVQLNVPRTPYNLRSAIKALAIEIKDLDGTLVFKEFDEGLDKNESFSGVVPLTD